MARSMVFAWMAAYREGGLEVLRARPVPGPRPKLQGAQLRRLYALIAGNDPRQLRFAFALWIRDKVRELIRRRGPWKGLDQVEYAALEWVDWFNNRRL
jgi:hypothetical protein